MPVKFKPTTKVRRRGGGIETVHYYICLLYTSPSPRDQRGSAIPSWA